jgi:hypothetical protein
MVNRIMNKISCVSDQRRKTLVLKYNIVPQILVRTSRWAERYQAWISPGSRIGTKSMTATKSSRRQPTESLHHLDSK